MKMLHIVCGKRFEDEIVAMFKDLGLNGYTVISGVGGSGVTVAVSVKVRVAVGVAVGLMRREGGDEPPPAARRTAANTSRQANGTTSRKTGFGSFPVRAGFFASGDSECVSPSSTGSARGR